MRAAKTLPDGRLKRRKRHINGFDVFLFIFCVGFGIICFYPLWYVFIVSITPFSEYIHMKVALFPRGIDLQYYQAIFSTSIFSRSVMISVLKTVLATGLSVVVTSMMAYGVSKLHVPGMRALNVMVVITMYFSGGLIPTYFLYRDIGILQTFWPMVLPMALNVSYFIIMRNYFIHSLPKELEEAALLDGASQLKAFFRVVLPVSVPMIAAITLFIGIQNWNDWYSFMMYVNRNELQPLSWMLRRVLVESSFVNNMAAEAQAAMGYKPPPVQLRMATIMVTTVPILVVYPFLQKYFTQGLMLGAVKE